jgi:uncharacterized membrane protein
LTNVYPNNNNNNNNNNNKKKKKNNKVKSKPLELFELAGKNFLLQLKILMMRATNIRAPRGVRVAGIFNSI